MMRARVLRACSCEMNCFFNFVNFCVFYVSCGFLFMDFDGDRAFATAVSFTPRFCSGYFIFVLIVLNSNRLLTLGL